MKEGLKSNPLPFENRAEPNHLAHFFSVTKQRGNHPDVRPSSLHHMLT